MEDLLMEWEFPELTQPFRDAGISIEVLKHCLPEELDQQLQTLKKREKITFLNFLQKWKDSPVEAVDTTDTTSSVSATPRRSPQLQVQRKSPATVSATPRRSPRLQVQGKSPAKETVSTARKQLSFEVNPATESSPLSKKAQKLKEYILLCPGGKSIFLYYEVKKKLDVTSCNRLTHILIDTELERSETKTITRERFIELKQIILELFPSEYPAAWYSEFKSTKGKKENATGRLVVYYHNARQKQIADGLLVGDERQSRKSNPKNRQPSLDNLSSDAKKLLAKDLDMKDVIPLWEKTLHDRLDDFNKKYESIEAYIQCFPVLKTSNSAQLFLRDFNGLFPGYEKKLSDAWPAFMAKLFLYAEQRCKVDIQFIQTLADLKISTAEDLVEDFRTVNALKLLGLLLCTRRPVKGSKKTWSPARKEAIEGFLVVLNSATDLENAVDEKALIADKHGFCFQFFLIIVLDELSKKTSSHVCFHKTLIECESPLKALDICFKLFFTLNAHYGPTCKPLWVFVQQFLYYLKTAKDSTSSSALKLAQRLEIPLSEPSSLPS